MECPLRETADFSGKSLLSCVTLPLDQTVYMRTCVSKVDWEGSTICIHMWRTWSITDIEMQVRRRTVTRVSAHRYDPSLNYSVLQIHHSTQSRQMYISACGSIVVFDHYEIFFARNSCTVTKTFLYRNDYAAARGDKRCANWHYKIVRKLLVKARVMAEICTVSLPDYVCFAYRVRQHIRRCRLRWIGTGRSIAAGQISDVIRTASAPLKRKDCG